MLKKVICTLAALAAFGAVAPAASAETTGPARTSCFGVTEWKGWNPTAAGDALYLRVRMNDIYRVQLSPGSQARRYAGDFLVSQVRGSNMICSPLDLDLAISDDNGFRRPLIATGLRKLTPAEIASIPRKELP